jgi:molybdopterin molybdotransferase
MLTVDQALQLVLDSVRPLAPRDVPLGEALGRRLLDDTKSDVDSPPHDKSVVDGYAIRYDDLAAGRAELRVVEEVTAGDVPRHAVEPGTAVRIMTGAPLPTGADAVVMVERTAQPAPDRVAIDDPKATRGQNIVRQATAFARGDVVLAASEKPLTPAQIGLLAEVGRATVRVAPRPRVAVLATGNELVPAAETPGPGQIRNSNGPMLAAFVEHRGATAVELGIARDERDALREKIVAGLAADVLLLSGGVSAGVLDLVPGVLQELGVREVFHKVQMKPGKPLWFGTFAAPDGSVKPVFGLPGNPVSTLVCFELFVVPALRRLQGIQAPYFAPTRLARLAEPFTHRGDRPTYWPGRYEHRAEATGDEVATLRWHGSGDLRGLALAECLICFPAGDQMYPAGTEVAFRPL